MNPDFFKLNIVEVGAFFLALGYLYTFWKQGGNKGISEALKINEQIITTLKEQHQINVEKISQLTKQVGELTGRLDEKEKQLTLLQQLVKTTPEQENYMIEMRKFTAGVAEYMASSTKTLGEVSVFMHNINNKEAISSSV